MLNFIVKLLKIKESLTRVLYNVILVITDKLIKYKYFILYKESSTVEKLTYTFLRVLAANYRISDKIILNKDKLFTLKF